MKEELEAAIEKGPHTSALKPDASRQFRAEAFKKQKEGFCRVVKWRDIQDDPPTNLKISPIAAVPHKSQKWQAILDLSF